MTGFWRVQLTLWSLINKGSKALCGRGVRQRVAAAAAHLFQLWQQLVYLGHLHLKDTPNTVSVQLQQWFVRLWIKAEFSCSSCDLHCEVMNTRSPWEGKPSETGSTSPPAASGKHDMHLLTAQLSNHLRSASIWNKPQKRQHTDTHKSKYMYRPWAAGFWKGKSCRAKRRHRHPGRETQPSMPSALPTWRHEKWKPKKETNKPHEKRFNNVSYDKSKKVTKKDESEKQTGNRF